LAKSQKKVIKTGFIKTIVESHSDKKVQEDLTEELHRQTMLEKIGFKNQKKETKMFELAKQEIVQQRDVLR